MTTQTAARLSTAERINRLDALTPAQQHQLLLFIDATAPRAVDKAIDYAMAADPGEWIVAAQTAPEPVTGKCGATDRDWVCSLDPGHFDADHEARAADGFVFHAWPWEPGVLAGEQDRADAAELAELDRLNAVQAAIDAEDDARGPGRFQGGAGPAAGDAAGPGPAEACGARDGEGRTACVLPAGHDGPHEDECSVVDDDWYCSLPHGHPGHHIAMIEGVERHHWPHASRSRLTPVPARVADFALGGDAAEAGAR